MSERLKLFEHARDDEVACAVPGKQYSSIDTEAARVTDWAGVRGTRRQNEGQMQFQKVNEGGAERADGISVQIKHPEYLEYRAGEKMVEVTLDFEQAARRANVYGFRCFDLDKAGRYAANGKREG